MERSSRLCNEIHNLRRTGHNSVQISFQNLGSPLISAGLGSFLEHAFLSIKTTVAHGTVTQRSRQMQTFLSNHGLVHLLVMHAIV